MKPDTQKKLQQHLKAIAEILYQEAEAEELESLAGIEKTIRAQTLEYITPEIGFFSLRSNRNFIGKNKNN
jgi:hypothetical protein